MAINVNVQLRSGYQPYFSFLTGFQSKANIASTVVTANLVTINFLDASKVEIATSGAAPVVGTDGDGNMTLVANVGSMTVRDPGNQVVVQTGAWGNFSGPLFGPNFLPAVLGNGNGGNIQPFGSETVTGAQTLRGYGAVFDGTVDRLTGGSGDDTLIYDPGTVMMNGGPNSTASQITGNDTFLFQAGTSIPVHGNDFLIVHGTSEFFPSPVLQPGEVNTVQAQSNLDFTYTQFQLVNRIVYDGATELLFAAGQFPDSSGGSTTRFAANTTVVGDNGANALEVWMSPSQISVGHLSNNGRGTVDLSQLVFQNWTPGEDTVLIQGDLTSGFGNTIKGPNVPTTILGGNGGNGDTLTGGSADDVITPLNDDGRQWFPGSNADKFNVSADFVDGGDGVDTVIYTGKRSQYTFDVTRDNNGVLHTVVNQIRGTLADGRDVLTNVERLQFSDGTISTAENLFDLFSAINAFDAAADANASASEIVAAATLVRTTAIAAADQELSNGPATPGRQQSHDSMIAAADLLGETIAAGGSPTLIQNDVRNLMLLSVAGQIGARAGDDAERGYAKMMDDFSRLSHALAAGAPTEVIKQIGIDALTKILGPVGSPAWQLLTDAATQKAAELQPLIDQGGAAQAQALGQFGVALLGAVAASAATLSPEAAARLSHSLQGLSNLSPHQSSNANIADFGELFAGLYANPTIDPDGFSYELASAAFEAWGGKMFGMPMSVWVATYIAPRLGAAAATYMLEATGSLALAGAAEAAVPLLVLGAGAYGFAFFLSKVLPDDDEFKIAFNKHFAPDKIGGTIHDFLDKLMHWGDVHITTFDGLKYDFQAAGEFVLTKSVVVGDSFEVQTRLEPWMNSESVTVSTQLAAKIGNDRVTFDADRPGMVLVNGNPVSLSESNPVLDLDGGQLLRVSAARYELEWDTGHVVVVSDRGSILDTEIDVAAAPGEVAGLSGPGQGQANTFKLPDGTVLAQPLSSTTLYTTFANAWRVAQQTSLFDYEAGETTATFTDLNFPAGAIRLQDLPQDIVAAARARAADVGIVDPVLQDAAALDFLATGDASFLTSARLVELQGGTYTAAVVNQSGALPVHAGVTAGATSVVENDNGNSTLTFNVYLTAAHGADTLIDWAMIVPYTGFFNVATFGGTLPSGQATILANQTTAQFQIALPQGATGTQPDGTLMVQIATPNGERIFGATAQTEVLNPRPVIISNGGDGAVALSVSENSTAVTTVIGRDLSLPSTLNYSIVGGADATRFQIDATTGALSFLTAPDFEAPTDANGDNSYVVQVQTSDGTLTDTQSLTVAVTNIAGVIANGSAATSTLFGSSETDFIDSVTGNHAIFGAGAGDFLTAGPQGDAIDGGSGFDFASWLNQSVGATLNLANPASNAGSAAGGSVDNVEVFYLTNAADTFTAAGAAAPDGAPGYFVYGFGDADTITGSAGSDFIDGGPWGDTLDGGAGFDYLSYYTAAARVIIFLDAPSLNSGEALGDLISNFEAFFLSQHNDYFLGALSGQNIVFGYEGHDELRGGFNANNWLFGGTGDDRMEGGGISDLFVGGDGADTLVLTTSRPIAGSSAFGFTPGTDRIEMGSGMWLSFDFDPGYTVSAGTTFVTGTVSNQPQVTQADPTFIYYTDLGLLYLDEDGTGATAANLLLQLAGSPALGANDFVLV